MRLLVFVYSHLLVFVALCTLCVPFIFNTILICLSKKKNCRTAILILVEPYNRSIIYPTLRDKQSCFKMQPYLIGYI